MHTFEQFPLFLPSFMLLVLHTFLPGYFLIFLHTVLFISFLVLCARFPWFFTNLPCIHCCLFSSFFSCILSCVVAWWLYAFLPAWLLPLLGNFPPISLQPLFYTFWVVPLCLSSTSSCQFPWYFLLDIFCVHFSLVHATILEQFLVYSLATFLLANCFLIKLSFYCILFSLVPCYLSCVHPCVIPIYFSCVLSCQIFPSLFCLHCLLVSS